MSGVEPTFTGFNWPKTFKLMIIDYYIRFTRRNCIQKKLVFAVDLGAGGVISSFVFENDLGEPITVKGKR